MLQLPSPEATHVQAPAVDDTPVTPRPAQAISLKSALLLPDPDQAVDMMQLEAFVTPPKKHKISLDRISDIVDAATTARGAARKVCVSVIIAAEICCNALFMQY
jgi:hypothetical protein